MQGYPKDTSDTGEIILSEEQKGVLRKKISLAVGNVTINAVFSLKGFFDAILITSLNTEDVIKNWNEFISTYKSKCTPKISDRTKNPPKITKKHKEALQEFWNRLRELGLLDETDQVISNVGKKIHNLLQKNSTD